MEPSMCAEKVKAPAAATVVMSSPAMVVSTPAGLAAKPTPVVYGKRPGSALPVAPPRKMMSTSHCSVLYSPGLTPTPPYYKYERSMTTTMAGTNALFNGNDLHHTVLSSPPVPALIPLTPPQTPDVK